MNIGKIFLQTVNRYQFIKKGDSVLIAFSGGMDSTALASLFLEIRAGWNLTLYLAHFNHKLRHNADRDEDHVRRQAERFGLPVYVGSENVRSYAAERHLNIEEAARLLRYRFLEQTAEKIKAHRVATAHTESDQAETFLMRLFRGSGRKGLAGVYPVVDNLFIRPLLFVDRNTVEAYITEKRLPFCLDESNSDRRYLRNKIRLDLIPFLQNTYDPQVITHLAQTANLLREEEELLHDTMEREAAVSIQRVSGRLTLDADRLATLPRGLTRRVVREYIKRLQGHLRHLSYADVEKVMDLEPGKKAHLKKDLILAREEGRIFAYKIPLAVSPYHYTWNGGEPLCIKEIGLRFTAHLRSGIAKPHLFEDSRRAFLDRDSLDFPLTVRNRRIGDRYRPLGAPGSRKVKEIFRTRGISPADRDLYPVFESGGEIVWIYGLPVAEKFKIRADTRSALLITLEKEKSC
ncbi:MAG: tRNA lysidine(34) synthetase TilS [Candidatus Aminicenantes bacterium]|nr:tRNA lysidine(34) synthetase TilS [Candidatus Aminicenantes bacterium]